MMSISTVAILWIVIGDDMRWRFPADRRCHASFFAGGDDAVPQQRRNIECVTRFQIGLKPWQAFRRQRVKGEGLVVIIFLEKDMADVRVQRIAHIQGFLQHALVEFQPRELSGNKMCGGMLVHGVGLNLYARRPPPESLLK